MSQDLLIRGATVYDGSGGPGVAADVLVGGERVAAVGQFGDETGNTAQEVDGTGLALAPGFIDAHSHDDFAVFLSPLMDFKVMQGVTTDVVGNCGFGPSPYTPAERFFRSWQPEGSMPRWDSYAGYFEALDRQPPSLNVVVLAGHNGIRAGARGDPQQVTPSGRHTEARPGRALRRGR